MAEPYNYTQPRDPNEDLWNSISQVGGGAAQAPTIWGMNPGGNASSESTPATGGFDFASLLKMFGGGGGVNSGGWLNGAATGAKALGDIGGLYLGIKQLGLAKDSFKLQKQAYKTNLANQTASYNTQVGDRVAGRSYNTEEERQAALKAALLPTGG